MNHEERWQLSGNAVAFYDRYVRLLMEPWAGPEAPQSLCSSLGDETELRVPTYAGRILLLLAGAARGR